MHRYQRYQTLPLILCSTLALACDDVDPSTAALTPERGLGERFLPVQVAFPQRAAPAQRGEATLDHSSEAQTTGAALGLPVHAKHLEGWVEWSASLPYYAGPIFDPSGELCGEGQSGPIWYLAGTAGGPVERECTIPPGKQLVFPLLNYYGAVPESYYTTPEEVEAYLADFEDTANFFRDITCTLSVVLDGVPLYGELADDTWLEVYDPFEVALPDSPDNFADWYGLVGGTTPAVGVGYYARTAPLPPGEHTLEFGGSLCFEGELWFETHASYTLHVE